MQGEEVRDRERQKSESDSKKISPRVGVLSILHVYDRMAHTGKREESAKEMLKGDHMIKVNTLARDWISVWPVDPADPRDWMQDLFCLGIYASH